MKVTDKQNPSMEGTSQVHGTKNKSRVTSKDSGKVSGASADELGSAKVKLSERAGDMKKIRAAVDSTPDVDEAKVAKYKSMLAKGEYKVDSKAVADKMVDEHAYNDFFGTNTED